MENKIAQLINQQGDKMDHKYTVCLRQKNVKSANKTNRKQQHGKCKPYNINNQLKQKMV